MTRLAYYLAALSVMIGYLVAAQVQAQATLAINGVYALGLQNRPTPAVVLANRNVDGVALRYAWGELEPQDEVFNWSIIDRDIADAKAHGKKVSFNITPGMHTPAWVYERGAAAFEFVWDKPWGQAACSTRKIPVPWDPVYLSKWLGFVKALGNRYDREPIVTHVKLTGINARTSETILPRARGELISNGAMSCPSGDDVSNWQRVGYTRAKVLTTWRIISDTFAQSFPDKKLALMIGPNGLPPIDGSGKVMGKKRADQKGVQDVISLSVERYGRRFILQNNGLSAFWDWKGIRQFSERADVAYQMLWSATDDPQCRMNHRVRPCDPHTVLQAAVDRGLDSGAKFLEIYIEDVLNPQLQDVLGKAHSSELTR